MRRLKLRQRAEDDLREIGQYIARDVPERASSFVGDLLDRVAALAENPLLYRARCEWDPGLRVANHGRYLILYRVNDEVVDVLRIVHSARDLAAIIDDLA